MLNAPNAIQHRTQEGDFCCTYVSDASVVHNFSRFFSECFSSTFNHIILNNTTEKQVSEPAILVRSNDTGETQKPDTKVKVKVKVELRIKNRKKMRANGDNVFETLITRFITRHQPVIIAVTRFSSFPFPRSLSS